MRWLAPLVGIALLLAWIGPAPAARSQSPVVVEFFTSQGCSSCPPADEIFSGLAREPGVLALALHVDYWDYLGWKDAFGKAAHTERQRAYAKANSQRSIFTPQMIVQGEDLLIGHDEEAIRAAIAAHEARPSRVALDVRRGGGSVEITLAPAAGRVGPAEVHVVEFVPAQPMTVEGGENEGYRHTFANVVTRWATIGRWDGASELGLRYDPVGQDEVAVVVQAARHGPVLAAARAR